MHRTAEASRILGWLRPVGLVSHRRPVIAERKLGLLRGEAKCGGAQADRFDGAAREGEEGNHARPTTPQEVEGAPRRDNDRWTVEPLTLPCDVGMHLAGREINQGGLVAACDLDGLELLDGHRPFPNAIVARAGLRAG